MEIYALFTHQFGCCCFITLLVISLRLCVWRALKRSNWFGGRYSVNDAEGNRNVLPTNGGFTSIISYRIEPTNSATKNIDNRFSSGFGPVFFYVRR